MTLGVTNSERQATSEHAMTEAFEKPRCGARTRAGGICKRPAGWATSTPGIGRCKLHGGALQTHGAHAVKTTDAATGALVDQLWAIMAGDPAAILREADRPALESVAVLLRQRERLETYLHEHGPIDGDGKARPAADLLVRVSRAILEHANALGMTPTARTRLGLDTAKTADIAAEFARMHRQRTDA